MTKNKLTIYHSFQRCFFISLEVDHCFFIIYLLTYSQQQFLLIFKGTVGSLPTGFEGSVDNPTSIATAIYSGLWAFGGWYVNRLQ